MFYPYFCTPKTKDNKSKVLIIVDLVAQLVEQYTFNVWALGSSPSRITSFKVSSKGRLFLCT